MDELIIAVSYERAVNILAQSGKTFIMFALTFGLLRLLPLEAKDIRDHVI
jgi:exosortase/archaeosortase